jgi:putative heme-binding domain-containing protein
MRGIVIGLFVVGVTVLPAQRRRVGQASGLSLPEEAVAEGRKVYNQTCTVCHGIDGTLGDRGPALAGNRRYLRTTDQELLEAIRDGIPGTLMPPAGLPEEVVRKVVVYIRSLRATAYDAPVKGDVARGEKIFWAKGQCGQCHVIQGKGGLTGPDLSNAGAQRTMSFLHEALTKEKPKPPRGYQPVRVVTAEGQTVTGILKNEDSFSLQLLDGNQKLRMFDRAELREVVYDAKSLMPADYDKKLAPQELEDLLAFLSRQAVSRVRSQQLGDPPR